MGVIRVDIAHLPRRGSFKNVDRIDYPRDNYDCWGKFMRRMSGAASLLRLKLLPGDLDATEQLLKSGIVIQLPQPRAGIGQIRVVDEAAPHRVFQPVEREFFLVDERVAFSHAPGPEFHVPRTLEERLTKAGRRLDTLTVHRECQDRTQPSRDRRDPVCTPLALPAAGVAEELFRRRVLRMLVRRERLEEDAAAGFLSWSHSGFSAHHALRVEPWDTAGVELLCHQLVHPPRASRSTRWKCWRGCASTSRRRGCT